MRFREQQLSHGRLAYEKACAVCHGALLEGGSAEGLIGLNFTRLWAGGHRTLRDLYEVIAGQMPKNAPGTLSVKDNLGIEAFILARNGHAPAVRLELGMLERLSLATVDLPPSQAKSHPGKPFIYGESATRVPDDAELLDVQPGDWLTYNRTLGGDRYSPLGQINPRNAPNLRVRCILQLGELGSFETSPLAYQGRLYLTTVHKVFAVDGSNCAVLWSYNWVPLDPEHLPGNRGAALYRGKLYRGTADGHLLALDAVTGKLLWDVRAADAASGYEITGAPVALDGKVFTGDAGADAGINGRVHAFDAATGAAVWAFNMIPSAGEPGATGSSMAIDPVARQLLVPVGKPAPEHYGKAGPGANIYTDAVVALQLDTGRVAWNVQHVPRSVPGWDTAAAPALFTQDGRHYMAVASNSGLLYLYDRDSRQVLAQTAFSQRENVDAPHSAEGAQVCPGALGQHNGPAYSPALKRLFVASAERCSELQAAEATGGRSVPDPSGKPSGWIKAFDAADGHEIWSVQRKDIVQAAVTPTAGGVLLTGDGGGGFLVLSAATGEILYQFATGGPIAAGITTYLAGNQQLIAVPSGSSSGDGASAAAAATLVIYALPEGH